MNRGLSQSSGSTALNKVHHRILLSKDVAKTKKGKFLIITF